MAQNYDLLHLLASVTPEFLKLAVFFTGQNKAALAARQRLNLEPFYAKLHLEFKILGESLSGWDDSIEISDLAESLIIRVLDVLESRFVKDQQDQQYYSRTINQSSKYRRLRDLRQRIDSTRGKDSSLDIQQLRAMIHLEDKKKENRVRMVNRLTKCNRELGIVLRKVAVTQVEYTFGAKAHRDQSQLGQSLLPSYQARDRATLLYGILAENWKCEGHSPHPDTRIRLSTYRSCSDEARFEVIFCSPPPTPAKWQESEILLAPRVASAKAKVVTFSVPGALPVPQVRTEDRWRVEGICQLVKEVATRTSCRLKLLLEDDKLWYFNPTSAVEDVQKKDQVSLGKFLELNSSLPFPLAKKRDKLILQVILANSLLHLYRGPWLLKNLNKTHICFYQARSQEIPDLTRPYLSTQCTTETQEQIDDEEDVRFRIHPYPGILALGILLLEIELGRPIEEERPEDSPNHHGIFHIDADRPVAMEMLDECRDDSSIDFVEAVEACLDDKTFIDAFGRDASFDNPAFRQQIFVLIVKPLETALQKVFGISVEKLDQLMAVVPRAARPRRKQTPSSSAQFAVQSSTSLLVEGFKSISLGDEPIQINQDHHVCLYDEGQDGIVSIQVSRHVDKWFTELNDRVVQPLIERGANRGTPSSEVFVRPGRVKVAILDTGLDLPEEAEWEYEHRIRARRSWLNNDELCGQILQKADGDHDGHGTHATALLLHIAPEAEVFVAQVFRDRKEISGRTMATVIHQRIANAIRYAVAEWKVDIISMSFGFEQSVEVIDEAIRLADDNNVIMFAAASNQGGNSNIAWPARLPQVICIYATDSYGNRCDFTPTESPRGDNFAVLGHAVKSCWPPHLGQGSEVRKSGTSTATPIAAGIAVIVLDFVKSALPRWDRQLSQEEITTLRKLISSAGMSTAFRRMRRTRAGYDYIVPWDLLDTKRYQESTVCDIILAELIAM